MRLCLLLVALWGASCALAAPAPNPNHRVFTSEAEYVAALRATPESMQEHLSVHIKSTAVWQSVGSPDGANAPEQVHLSATTKNSEMVVSWITPNKSASVVQFGRRSGSNEDTASGSSDTYRYLFYKSGHIHFATMTGLEANTRYYYRVGDPAGTMSAEFSFVALPDVGPNVPFTFSVVGDLGQTNFSQQTIDHMAKETDCGMILHVGDLSYADTDQERWDNWGRLIEPLAVTKPWMVGAGNHEIEGVLDWKFIAYDHRFKMPGEQSGGNGNLWFSFEVASSHVIVLNSYSSLAKSDDQYKWLQGDLKRVDRTKTPWLFVIYHAPIYNSNHAHHEEKEEQEMKANFEPLFHDARVNAVFSGHVHSYERNSAVFQNQTVPNGRAPVYVNIGDGGNREGLEAEWYDKPEWSAFREAAYGHGKLHLANSTHANWQWHRDLDSECKVSDEVWLVNY